MIGEPAPILLREAFLKNATLISSMRVTPELTIRRSLTNQEKCKRDREVRRQVLARAAGLCEFCGEAGFLTHGGAIYLETHHVIPLSEGGADRVDNVVALCPNDHRKAHHSKDRHEIRQALVAKIQSP
jgi:5-methylcytosine-specific restriction protein A